jgi:hypothetical protein
VGLGISRPHVRCRNRGLLCTLSSLYLPYLFALESILPSIKTWLFFFLHADRQISILDPVVPSFAHHNQGTS